MTLIKIDQSIETVDRLLKSEAEKPEVKNLMEVLGAYYDGYAISFPEVESEVGAFRVRIFFAPYAVSYNTEDYEPEYVEAVGDLMGYGLGLAIDVDDEDAIYVEDDLDNLDFAGFLYSGSMLNQVIKSLVESGFPGAVRTLGE